MVIYFIKSILDAQVQEKAIEIITKKEEKWYVLIIRNN
jgi:hypothetical protein